MGKQSFSEHFENEFQKLNENQKIAVSQIDGPVLVLAGPGTGKTQILAARIANMLLKTDALPENILCLTYTDSGTIAMRKRLQRFIGADAYRVGIFTFHAFCNKVIQENLELFGFRNLDTVSELEQIEIVHKIIDSFSSNNPLKRYTGEVYYDTQNLLNLYALMKRDGWTPEFLKQKSDEYILDLPLRDGYIYKRDSKDGKKGELKKKEIESEAKRMERLKAAADTLEQYQQKLKENKRYDFDDMILWVIDAFKNNENLLAHYRETFQYFLVDEFQDTSGTQIELFNLLIEDIDGNPDAFVVGDENQSIFRFQGAEKENMDRFKKQYEKNIHKIELNNNYRSSQNILDAAQSLIIQNLSENEISTQKSLIASNPEVAQLPNVPEICVFPNQAHETIGIALEIEKLIGQKINPKEIAVIYRNHTQAEEIIEYLRSKKIPLNAKKRVNIFEEMLIKKVLKILQFVDAELSKPSSGEHFLFSMLHFDEFGIAPKEIARMSYEINSKNGERDFSNKTWRGFLSDKKNKTAKNLFSELEKISLEKFSETIEEILSFSANHTVQELLQKIILRCGLLATALSSDEKSWSFEVLATFFDFVKDECSKNPKTNLHSLLTLVSLMEENKIALPAEKIICAENGVSLLTAHAAKGLEFEYVFIIGCISDKWDKVRNINSFKFPDNLFENKSDEMEESRRLFYVAMTRAKKELVISYPEKNVNGKELEASRFIAELIERKKVQEKKMFVEDEKLISFFAQKNLINEKISSTELLENNFLDSLLQHYSLSITHLNNYLKCPVSFYFENLLRVPAPKSASMTFGSAVHIALEKLFRKMNDEPEKKLGTEEEFIKDFCSNLYRHEDAFTESDFKRRLEYGVTILKDYYQKYFQNWNKVVSIERIFNVVSEGIPLNGKIDKLEFDGRFANVVDYKTGQFKNAEKKLRKPNAEKVEQMKLQNKEANFEDLNGGNYWRQAVFYKILIDNTLTNNWEFASAEFDFIEPDKDTKEYKKFKLEISPQDVSTVKKQIQSTYKKIKNKEFTDGCGEPDCEWCNFVKEFYRGNKKRK